MAITTDVTVVGAGIVGAACAYFLAREGVRVQVVDGRGIGNLATAAGMGHIVVMDDSEQQLTLTRCSQLLWDVLAEEFPRELSLRHTGTLWVAADEDEMQEVRRKSAVYAKHSIRTRILDAIELRETEPSLTTGLSGALQVPGDSVVYPPRAADVLIRKAREFGATTSFGKPVHSIGERRACLSDGTVFHSRMIINAAGLEAARLTPGIGIYPRKGHLVITDRYPGTVRHQLVELGYLKSAHTSSGDSVAFNVQPRETGQLLIGSSRQRGVSDCQVDSVVLSQMLNRAFLYMPNLASMSAVRVWTGVRAATPDKLPLIGPWARDESVFLATGHEGLGITTSLVTGRLAADYFLGGEPIVPLEPYLPSRPFEAGALV